MKHPFSHIAEKSSYSIKNSTLNQRFTDTFEVFFGKERRSEDEHAYKPIQVNYGRGPKIVPYHIASQGHDDVEYSIWSFGEDRRLSLVDIMFLGIPLLRIPLAQALEYHKIVNPNARITKVLSFVSPLFTGLFDFITYTISLVLTLAVSPIVFAVHNVIKRYSPKVEETFTVYHYDDPDNTNGWQQHPDNSSSLHWSWDNQPPGDIPSSEYSRSQNSSFSIG